MATLPSRLLIKPEDFGYEINSLNSLCSLCLYKWRDSMATKQAGGGGCAGSNGVTVWQLCKQAEEAEPVRVVCQYNFYSKSCKKVSLCFHRAHFIK
jgi:hypothetical protein